MGQIESKQERLRNIYFKLSACKKISHILKKKNQISGYQNQEILVGNAFLRTWQVSEKRVKQKKLKLLGCFDFSHIQRTHLLTESLSILNSLQRFRSVLMSLQLI